MVSSPHELDVSVASQIEHPCLFCSLVCFFMHMTTYTPESFKVMRISQQSELQKTADSEVLIYFSKETFL